MAKWNDIFMDDKCPTCGKKGSKIVSYNGKVKEIACVDHYEELQKELDIKLGKR